MSLLAEVVRLLERDGVAHALIGAAALAIHGVSRSTADVDLLAVDATILREDRWAEMEAPGRDIRILKGEAEDPLAGTVRLVEGSEIVDVVVGRYSWQREIIEAAAPLSLGDLRVPVAVPAGLILLKLHAGGPKDAWDIRALLEVVDGAANVEAEVGRLVPRLPADAGRLWARLRGPGQE